MLHFALVMTLVNLGMDLAFFGVPPASELLAPTKAGGLHGRRGREKPERLRGLRGGTPSRLSPVARGRRQLRQDELLATLLIAALEEPRTVGLRFLKIRGLATLRAGDMHRGEIMRFEPRSFKGYCFVFRAAAQC